MNCDCIYEQGRQVCSFIQVQYKHITSTSWDDMNIPTPQKHLIFDRLVVHKHHSIFMNHVKIDGEIYKIKLYQKTKNNKNLLEGEGFSYIRDPSSKSMKVHQLRWYYNR